MPPYLQIAIDAPDMGVVERVLKNVPKNDHVIIEAGTPLIKRYGLSVISQDQGTPQGRLRRRGPEDAGHRQPGGPHGRRRDGRCGRLLRAGACRHHREVHRGSPQGRHLLDHRHAERREPGEADRRAQGQAGHRRAAPRHRHRGQGRSRLGQHRARSRRRPAARNY